MLAQLHNVAQHLEYYGLNLRSMGCCVSLTSTLEVLAYEKQTGKRAGIARTDSEKERKESKRQEGREVAWRLETCVN